MSRIDSTPATRSTSAPRGRVCPTGEVHSLQEENYRRLQLALKARTLTRRQLTAELKALDVRPCQQVDQVDRMSTKSQALSAQNNDQ